MIPASFARTSSALHSHVCWWCALTVRLVEKRPDNDSANDHREVRCQTAMSLIWQCALTVRLVEKRPDNDSANDHREVRCQTAMSLIFTKKSELVVCQCGKDPLAQNVAIFCLEPEFTLTNRVVDHMQDETEKTIHKIFPSPMLPIQATLQKYIIHVIR